MDALATGYTPQTTYYFSGLINVNSRLGGQQAGEIEFANRTGNASAGGLMSAAAA